VRRLRYRIGYFFRPLRALRAKPFSATSSPTINEYRKDSWSCINNLHKISFKQSLIFLRNSKNPVGFGRDLAASKAFWGKIVETKPKEPLLG
jgi:hypothetical protein